MTYVATSAEIAAQRPRPDRWRELVRLSDRLLAELEELNWSTYRDREQSLGFERVPLPGALARRINELLVQAGQEGKLRRLRSTADALAAVFHAQGRLFGPESSLFGPEADGEAEENDEHDC